MQRGEQDDHTQIGISAITVPIDRVAPASCSRSWTSSFSTKGAPPTVLGDGCAISVPARSTSGGVSRVYWRHMLDPEQVRHCAGTALTLAAVLLVSGASASRESPQ